MLLVGALKMPPEVLQWVGGRTSDLDVLHWASFFLLSTFFPLIRLCTLGLLVMMTSLSNSRKPTNVRACIKYIKSRKAKRQALAPSSSQDTRGIFPFIQSIFSSLKHFQLSRNQFTRCWKFRKVTFIIPRSCASNYRCKVLLCWRILSNPRCGVCSWT